jgi:uncharacterized damage-inducible protein DinB
MNGGDQRSQQVGGHVSMTSREFYLERRRAELPVFLNVLRALPPDRLDYKPHDRSPSAQQLAWTLTKELGNCLDVVRSNKSEWSAEPAPPFEEILSLFEQRSRDLIELVTAMDEGSWNAVAHFYYGGKLVSEQPASQFLWYIHFDAIHHRGQLSAYIRPMGGTVPAIYGPSADSRA